MRTLEDIQKLEEVYRKTVAGLRQLGHTEIAAALEHEQFILYGDPDAPRPPVGIIKFNEQVRK